MKYAFYSKTTDEARGHAVYRRADGTEVVTTGVCDDPGGECYKWPDKEFLGEVLSVQEGGFVRSAHLRQRQPTGTLFTDYGSTTPHRLAAVRHLLGAVPDQQVAVEAGAFIDADTVACERERLRIPAYRPPLVK